MAEEENQPAFSFYGLDRIDRSKPVYHATGSLVARHRPEVYRIAVDLLAQGKHSVREMCQILHVSAHTLESIEANESQTLATLRASAARRNMRLHHLSLDRLEELIPTMPDGAKVAVVAGITAEKAQLFAGEATARIESIEPVSIVDRFRAFVTDLEQRVAARLNGCEPKKMGANAIPLEDRAPIHAPSQDCTPIAATEVKTDRKANLAQPITEGNDR